MDALLSADGSNGGAEPVEESRERMRATGAAVRVGARSRCARWLSLSGAAFAGERR